VTGSRTKFHNEELHDLYSLRNVISMINLRRMRWTGRVAGMEEMRNGYRI
jgi:hypothetical protein